MGVTFLFHVVTWDGQSNLLQFVLATAFITAALNLFRSGREVRRCEGSEGEMSGHHDGVR
jgi:hypothetical protein